jgi:hypothetical protein
MTILHPHVLRGLPVADGQKATFSIAVVVSTIDVPCFWAGTCAVSAVHPKNAVKKQSYHYRAVKHAQLTGVALQAASQAKRWKLSRCYGNPKSGFHRFCQGKVDVLIGTRPLGTGVDGLQKVCNRLVMLVLPWTGAEYEQTVGRIRRQGSTFTHVEIILPQVLLGVPVAIGQKPTLSLEHRWLP